MSPKTRTREAATLVFGEVRSTCCWLPGSSAPGEVLASSTVEDLAVGSGIEFAERGEVELKGVPGTWRSFSVGT